MTHDPRQLQTARSSTVLFHIQPRASRTEVAGWHGDAIKIRVKAPPVDGAANRELLRFLAQSLHVPRAAIQLVTGESGRQKRVRIRGMDAERVTRTLLGETGGDQGG